MKATALNTFSVAAVLLLAWPLAKTTIAAPFCIKNQVIPDRCIYYDAAQCQSDAQKQNAECVANPNETRLIPGYGKYCVITSDGASNCNYTDQGTCSRDAVRHGGTCTTAPTAQPLQGPNAFSNTEGQ